MQFDPEVARRLAELSAEAERLASKPDVGPEDVRRLEEMYAEACRLAGIDERPRARVHELGGRPIDLPVTLPDDLIPWLLPERRRERVSRPPMHIHWAYDS